MEVNDDGGVNQNGDTIQPTDRHELQQAVSVDVVDILPESDTEPAERKPLAEASVSYQKKVPRSKSVTERAMNRWRTVQTHVQERGEAKRAAVSKWQNVAELTRSMSHGVADFLGVAEEAKEERDKRIEKWRARSRRMHSNSVFLRGHKMPVQPEYTDSRSVASGEEMEMGSIGQGFDQVDGLRSSRRVPQPIDPLSRGRRTTSRLESYTSVTSGYRSLRFQSVKKNSVMKMAYDGLRTLTLGSVEKPTTATPLKSRSFSPAVKTAMACNNVIDLTLDDTFFDVAQPTSARVVPYVGNTTPCASRLMNSITEAAEETLLPGARKPVNVPTAPQTPSTPGIDDVDGAIGSSQHIGREVLDLIWQRSERQVGVGLVGRLFKRKYRQSKIEQANEFADDFDTHRPYFTYWVTFVQITCFVFTIAVYNTASWGVFEEEIPGEIRMPNGAWERHVRREQSNMWFGPRQEDLIHIGAKFSPCMREDGNVMRLIFDRRKEEAQTACCVRNDLSICMQTNEANCTSLLWSWQKFYSNATEIHKRGGSVCGYDYSTCSEGFSPDDISTWPICDKKSSGDERHLKCETVARPCCVGKQGQCMITSPDHCAFLKGYFHPEAHLCSQVDCLSDVCGMLPFLYKDQPNQFYRLWTSLFIHAGIIPLLITVFFQVFIMRDLEKLAGWLRIGLIYIISGIAGNLASAIFLPYHPEAGPTGSQFGLLACLVVEVIQSWQFLSNPCRALSQLLVVLLVLLCLGFLPWIDNYAHVTGLIFGFLLSFPLLPHIAYLNRKLRVIIVTLCLLFAAGLFTVLVVFFYVRPLYSCDGCEFFNCIPFTKEFCNSMKVYIDPNQR